MKNIIFYYTAVIVPGVVLAILWQDLKPGVAMPLLFAYFFLYRSLLDGWRLVAKGVIQKNQIWKMAIPGMPGKYLKQLYFKK